MNIRSREPHDNAIAIAMPVPSYPRGLSEFPVKCLHMLTSAILAEIFSGFCYLRYQTVAQMNNTVGHGSYISNG
jgi:hypothetical protein